VGLKDWWSLPLWIPRLLDIRRIARETSSILNQVTVPVMIFQSRRDETVNPESVEFINRGLGNPVSFTYLQQSTHAYFELEEFNQIIKGIKRLIDMTI
jgi:esterase/lipase